MIMNARTDLYRGEIVLCVRRAASVAIGIKLNLSIKGRIYKEKSLWKAEIPALGIVVQSVRPLKCLEEMENYLKSELQDENLKCIFKITDAGVIYLITAET